MKIILMMVLFSHSLWAISVSKKMQVLNHRWDQERSLYRLELHGHAGAYFVSEKHLPCVKKSIELKKPVTLTYDVRTLVISDCQ